MLVLPHTSIVNRVVPKNSFEKYINTKQKKLFTEYVDKIRWTHKLSTQTVKLAGKDISEIQLFEIYLKKKLDSDDVLNIIDRYIPYHIIFDLIIENEVMYSVAQKHPNPAAEDISVIDWRFNSNWFKVGKEPYSLNLKKSLDDVFSDFCLQVSGKEENRNKSLPNIIAREQRKKQLTIEINKLEAEIKNCKQFNIKVELNLKLNNKQKELKNT